MIGRSKPGRGAFATCRECSVGIPISGDPTCRCCAADGEPPNTSLSADTTRSPYLMDPMPEWPVEARRNFPKLESARLSRPDGSEADAALWWKHMGTRWIAQHPLEYPRNRLRNRGPWDVDSTPLED